MRIVEIDGARESAWQEFVRNDDRSMTYYSLPYRDLLSEITGGIPRYWLALEGSRPVGVLPTMWQDGPQGQVVNALPFFGSHGGPLALSGDVQARLLEHWSQETSAPDVCAATMIESPLSRVDRPGWVPSDRRLAAFTLFGREGSGSVFDKLPGSVRRNFTHAVGRGVVVERVEPSLEHLEWLYTRHCENMSRIGGVPKPAQFVQVLHRTLVPDSQVSLYVASVEENLVASILFLNFGRTIEYFMPGITDEGREFQATAPILVRAMEDGIAEGMQQMNWGGTWASQEGVWRFKNKWANFRSEYNYYTTCMNAELLECSEEDLRSQYPHSYVVPYEWLHSNKGR